MHVAKLGSVAFVKNHHHLFLVEVALRVLLDVGREFLNGGNDDFALGVVDLFLQLLGRGVAVGCALLEAVIFLHRLVVQILAVNHKQHFVDIGEFGGELGSLE